MPEIQLTPKERQTLKARAHGLKPVVLLGNSGLSSPVMKEIDRALAAHELIGIESTELNKLFGHDIRSHSQKFVIRQPVTFQNSPWALTLQTTTMTGNLI